MPSLPPCIAPKLAPVSNSDMSLFRCHTRNSHVGRVHSVRLLKVVVFAFLAACTRKPTDLTKLNAELLEATRKGDTGSVQHLLQKGATIEAKDRGGSTPLALAANCRHADTAKLLLAKGADLVAGGLAGENALSDAAVGGNSTRVALILERGSDSKTSSNALFAMSESRPLVVTEEKQDYPVELAFPNDSEIVKLLVEHGADIEARDEEEATPLMRAAEFGQTGIVRALLEHGANAEAEDKYGDTTLIAAACECAVIDMPETLPSMKLLLQKGVDVNARNKVGTTALMAAASYGRAANIQLLIGKGAKIDTKDKDGNTALLISAAPSALPMADATRVLLDRGANIEARNNQGDTALILASKGGYEDARTVRLLLSRGADVGAKDKHGYTALTFALKNHRTAVASLLKRAMAARQQ